MKKEKKKKMELIIKNIETNMNDIILEVCNLEKSPFGNSTEENLLSSSFLVGISSGGMFGAKERSSSEKSKNFNAIRMNSILP